MKVKNYIKRIIKKDYPFLNPFYTLYLKYKCNAWGVVFVLHRVAGRDVNKPWPNEYLKIEPTHLEEIIKKYIKAGVDFYSLDDLAVLLESKEKPLRPFVCFTLDDGYVDNYTNAYPIFKEYNIPFAVYVATDFPDGKAFLWWYHLEDYLSSKDSVTLKDGSVYSCKTLSDRTEAFLSIRKKILSIKHNNFLNDYKTLLEIEDFDYLSYVKKCSMSWEQIEEMSKDPLCTIAGHTVSHPPLNQLTKIELADEVNNGCAILSEHIKTTINHFSFPFGTSNEIGEREHDYMKKTDFRTVTMVEGRLVDCNTVSKNIGRLTLL